MDRKGQGALEYLLLIGGAVLVAVVVILLLTSMSGAGELTSRLSSAKIQCLSDFTDSVACNAGTQDFGGDQFDIGWLGASAMEAMAQGIPVMIYIDESCTPLIYEKPPPVLNCKTEDDVFEAIMGNQNRQKLQKIGDISERWVRRNHADSSDMLELSYRICVASGIPWPHKR